MADLTGILPSNFGLPPAGSRGGASAAALRGKSVAKALPRQGLMLRWCGNPRDVLEVSVDEGTQQLRWVPADKPALQIPLDVGSHKCDVTNCVDGSTHSLSAVAVEGEWCNQNVGEVWEEVVCEPASRSQFSFPGGRSACSFLVCEAALQLHDLFVSLPDPAAGVSAASAAVVDAGVVARCLEGGMARYEGGGRGALEAAGLEHSNPSDVVELCGWLFDDGRVQVAPHGKFWGSLAEDDALAETLALAVSAAEQAFPDAPALVAITRPPETVLLLSDRRAGTVGVLDTHSRAAGIAQHPSAFYRCRSLDAAAQLLRFIFFPLPEEMEPEVTPFPLPLPPPPPPLPSSCPPPTPAEASSARAAQELGLYSLFELTVFCVAAPRAGERGGSTPDAGGGETRAGSGGADKPGERDGAGAGAPHAAP